VLSVTARRDRLDHYIAALAADSEFTPIVRRLCCLRGISTLTGFALAVEIGDWSRFTGTSIGAFVGLVPSEHSSGESRSQGPITKAGNTHARRLLVEAAWHHRARYLPSKTLRARWDLASPAARGRGDAGNRRLHARWVRFIDRKVLAWARAPRGPRRLTVGERVVVSHTGRGPDIRGLVTRKTGRSAGADDVSRNERHVP
jgi:hypothetical protein